METWAIWAPWHCEITIRMYRVLNKNVFSFRHFLDIWTFFEYLDIFHWLFHRIFFGSFFGLEKIFFEKYFFNRKYFRSKYFRRNFFRPHISIQKITKIPKITLRKLFDEAWSSIQHHRRFFPTIATQPNRIPVDLA